MRELDYLGEGEACESGDTLRNPYATGEFSWWDAYVVEVMEGGTKLCRTVLSDSYVGEGDD